ncbi:MAG: hypothetical protein GXX96_28515 [Planctomycetaceae bacterium]|nr:hypothetical protein [Planctomycetaceae bacterium]
MSHPRCIGLAKITACLGFLVLLSTTYWLRTEVLALNELRFSADETRAQHELTAYEDAFPHEEERYQVELKNYELEIEHFKTMFALYESDYEEYARRLEDKFEPPQMPVRPEPPRAPEYAKKLHEINTRFRARKHHYFEMTSRLNWVAWIAATALVGGLLYLIMFDSAGGRIIYFAVLVMSFMFMIGPSFHSIISAIVGFLEPPSVY